MSESPETMKPYTEATPEVMLTDAQTQALLAMRATFKDADGCGMSMNDKTYLRYLRARNFDLKKATSLLNGTLKWRKDFGVADLHSKEWTDIVAKENETGKVYSRGFDKLGHLILYMRPKLENTMNHDGNVKHLVYHMERAIAIMEATTGEEKLSLIIDYEGFSLSNAPPMKTSRETLTILQDHYPERLYRAYCVRPPFIFNAFWTMLTPFIDSATKQKILMIPNSELAKPGNQVHSEIDLDVLEQSLGGNDSRPYDSQVFLSGPYEQDYRRIIDTDANQDINNDEPGTSGVLKAGDMKIDSCVTGGSMLDEGAMTSPLSSSSSPILPPPPPPSPAAGFSHTAGGGTAGFGGGGFSPQSKPSGLASSITTTTTATSISAPKLDADNAQQKAESETEMTAEMNKLNLSAAQQEGNDDDTFNSGLE